MQQIYLRWEGISILRMFVSICFCWSSKYWNILSGLLINICYLLGIIYWVERLFRLRRCLLNFQYWNFWGESWLKAFKNYELFIWLCQILVVAHGIFDFFWIKIFWNIFAIKYCMCQMFNIVTLNFLNVLFDIDSRTVAMEVGITKECITTYLLNKLVLKM